MFFTYLLKKITAFGNNYVTVDRLTILKDVICRTIITQGISKGMEVYRG